MQKFLIIQTAFIGDVVLALPLAQQLKQQHSRSEVHMLIRKGNETLLDNHPAIDRVWIWDKKQHKLRHLWQLIGRLRQHRFDHIYNLHRFLSSGLITLCCKAKAKSGFDKNPLSWYYTRTVPHRIPHEESGKTLHEVQRNLSLLEFLEDPPLIRPELFPSTADREKVKSLTQRQPYIVVAPASVWYTKQWHASKWEVLIRQIPEKYAIYLIGAPGDKGFCATFTDLHPYVRNLCGELSFLQSAALMQSAARVIVNDSAPLHFASAVNAKTTAVFCSTVPEFGFGPLATDSTVVEVKETLECRPCGLHGYRSCPEGHFKCALHIDEKAVLDTIPD